MIGNGDVDSPQAAADLLNRTGCDGVMIGRAAQGNPWIFRQVTHFLEKGELPAPPGKEEKRELILRHAAMLLACKGEYTAVREMRKHLAWYTAGMPHSARFRSMINAMETMEMLTESVEQICISETQDA